MLKRFLKSTTPYESSIGLRLSSEPLASDPRNHAGRVFETLDVPGQPDDGIIVMDYLRQYDDPSFETVGEVVDFFRQIFEVSVTLFDPRKLTSLLARAYNFSINTT